MRTVISTELLLRLMNATPEQYAAVEKILAATPSELPPVVTEDVARSAFALLIKLDADGKHKAPTPLTIFRYYCIEGLSAGKVADKCRCSKATVIGRLQFIAAETNTKAEDFRAMSGHLQQIADDYENSGAREIYRRGLVDGGETDETDHVNLTDFLTGQKLIKAPVHRLSLVSGFAQFDRSSVYRWQHRET